MYKSYFYKVIKDGKVLDSRKAPLSRKKSFTRQMRLVKTPKGSKYYLKVSYTCSDFKGINEGWYSNKKDLLFAFKAFDEC